MQGVIEQVSISGGGVPKHAVESGVIAGDGVAGDAHAHPKIHGGPDQAILLVAAEVLDELRSRGYALFAGALGENLTTRGIDFKKLGPGSRLRAGEALLEIRKPRKPCLTLDVYGAGLQAELYDESVKALGSVSPRWGMGDIFAVVR